MKLLELFCFPKKVIRRNQISPSIHHQRVKVKLYLYHPPIINYLNIFNWQFWRVCARLCKTSRYIALFKDVFIYVCICTCILFRKLIKVIDRWSVGIILRAYMQVQDPINPFVLLPFFFLLHVFRERGKVSRYFGKVGTVPRKACAYTLPYKCVGVQVCLFNRKYYVVYIYF